MNLIKAFPLLITSLSLPTIKSNPLAEFSNSDDCWSYCEDKCGNDIYWFERCYEKKCEKLVIDPRDEEHIELYNKAARISQGVYFVDSKNDFEHNCEDDDGSKYEFCKTNESGDDAKVNAAAIIKKDDKCYVVFRGTRSNIEQDSGWSTYEDMKTNLDTHQVSFPLETGGKCYVFAGFAEAYTDMKAFIKEELPECKRQCDDGSCLVVLTGHSQGGAAAVAASLDESMIDLFDDPYVITFGAPPVLNDIETNRCESLINRDKHFRLVTAKEVDDSLTCDPIAEHSKKIYDITFHSCQKPRNPEPEFCEQSLDGSGMEDGIHIGHTVLLKGIEKTDKERLGDVVIATAYGDHTCVPFLDTDEPQTLNDWDFHQGGDSIDIDPSKPIPLHNIDQAYRLILKAAVKSNHGYEKGFKIGQRCTQDWQCDSGTCAAKKCLAKTLEKTVSYPSTGKILVEYAQDFDFFEKLGRNRVPTRVPMTKNGQVQRTPNGAIKYTSLNKYNRVVRITRIGGDVIECLEPKIYHDFVFSPIVDVDYRLSYGGYKIGSSIVLLEFGEGSCDDFTKRDEINIKFGDDSKFDAVIELKRVIQKD